MNDSDIPLTNVHTSSSTGARKPGNDVYMHNQTLAHTPTITDNEKSGLFKRSTAKRGLRKAKKINSRPQRVDSDGEAVKVNGLGRFYSKIVNFSVVTRYLVYVLPIALMIAVPIIIYAVIKPHALFASTGVRVYLFWTWIEILWLSIWVSKLVAQVLPWVFMFICGVVSSGTRKYAKILEALEIPLSMVGWSATALVTFTALTSQSLNNRAGADPGWISIMKKLLAPALIASIIFLVEKMCIQLISINYHRRSFDQRIKESKHNVHLLGLLYDASRTLFPMYCQEFVEEDYAINDSIEAMLAKTTGHSRSGSATPLKLIGDMGRLGDKVTSVFGNVAQEITGKQVFNPNSAHSIVVEALEKTKSSQALAKRLWFSFVIEGKDALYMDDVKEVLGPGREEEAEDAFTALDNDGNGDISLDEMILKVVEIGRDRKSISQSMRDVGQAIGVLDQVIVTVLFVIVIFIFVAFQNANFTTTLATAGTTLLSLSFVFAASVQEFLGSCIFLFIKHPFDVGDRVDIAGGECKTMVVEQISLLYTIFKRIDTMKMVQVPNIVLNNLWVENVTRSKAMKEQLDMFISFDTSLEDIELLRREMETFVREPDNARDFQPDIILEATGIGNMDKLQLKVEIRHKSNWHNETVRAARRSKFMCALVLALRKVPIYGPGGGGEPLGGPTNPGYSVSIDDTWASEARDKAKAAKEGKRLVPSAPAAPKESDAADALNSRDPAADAAHMDTDRQQYSNREDGARDASLERKRSTDIDDLRQGLLKRESTRGKRRPGEHMPPMPSAAGPGFSVTQPSPTQNSFAGQSMGQVLDEEAAVGYSPQQQQSQQSQYGSSPAYGGGQGQYSMFPTTSQQQQGNYNPYAAELPTQSSPGNTPQQQQQSRFRRLSLGFKPAGPQQSSQGAGGAH